MKLIINIKTCHGLFYLCCISTQLDERYHWGEVSNICSGLSYANTEYVCIHMYIYFIYVYMHLGMYMFIYVCVYTYPDLALYHISFYLSRRPNWFFLAACMSLSHPLSHAAGERRPCVKALAQTLVTCLLQFKWLVCWSRNGKS